MKRSKEKTVGSKGGQSLTDECYKLMEEATQEIYRELPYPLPLPVFLGRGRRSSYRCRYNNKQILQHKIIYGKKAIEILCNIEPFYKGLGGWTKTCVDFYSEPSSALVTLAHLILHELAHTIQMWDGYREKPHCPYFFLSLQGLYKKGYHKKIMELFRVKASPDLMRLLQSSKEKNDDFSCGETVKFLHQNRWVRGTIIHADQELAKVKSNDTVWRIPYNLLQSVHKAAHHAA